MTDKNGKYQAGPFYDDQKYDVRAEKEDFSFQSDEQGNFKALKHSSITIFIVDKENGNPIPEVFLSLSSGKFRATGTTDDKGKLKFMNLKQGKFYATAILKEYEFEETSIAI